MLPSQDPSLSEGLSSYIATQFTPEMQVNLETSFTLLHAMGLRYYEDRFLQILSLQGSIDSEEVCAAFMAALFAMLSDVLDQHHIRIDPDSEVRLAELNELVGFLLLVQSLEDTEQLSYRLSGFDSPRAIISDLLAYYTLTPKYRWAEIVSDVQEDLLIALHLLVQDKQNPEDDPRYSQAYLAGWKDFCEYTEGTDCLGKQLSATGHRAVSLDHLLSEERVQVWIEDTVHVQPERALDLWSLLALSRDYQELPLLGFEKNASLFCPDLEQVSRMKQILSRMLADFSDWRVAKRQAASL